MKTPLRIAIPLTLALAFPVGAAVAQSLPSAHATTCGPYPTEAWSLELVDVVLDGDLDPDVEAIAWPANGIISESAFLDPVLHDGEGTFSITLREVKE